MSTLQPETMARALRRTAASAPLWLDASGRSMGRAILTGSRVLVTVADHPRWGEIWAFCEDDDIVLVHRCRGQRGGAFLFQGDALLRRDPPVAPDRLIGRVVAVEHRGRRRELGGRDRWASGVRSWARTSARWWSRRVVLAIGRRPRRSRPRA